MAEFRCTVVTDPERSEQTIFLKYQEELFAHFEIDFLVESLSLRREREEGGGLARFFPSSLLLSRAPDLVSSSTSSAASLFRRAQCSRLKCSPRGTNARARFERKRTVGIRRLSNFVSKNLPTLHTFFPPTPGVKLISIKSALPSCSHSNGQRKKVRISSKKKKKKSRE